MKNLPVSQHAIAAADGTCDQAWYRFFDGLTRSKVMESSGLLENIPTWLKKADAGYVYRATDFARRFLWTGTAWEYADVDPHRYVWCDEAPGVGWALADGSSVTRTNPDGTTESYTVKDLRGRYLKGGTTPALAAAKAPALTGDTADESTHTHSINHSHANPYGSGASSANITLHDGTGGAATVATSGHGHAIEMPMTSGLNSGAGAAHKHGKGTLAVDATGEPASAVLIPYYRL